MNFLEEFLGTVFLRASFLYAGMVYQYITAITGIIFVHFGI